MPSQDLATEQAKEGPKKPDQLLFRAIQEKDLEKVREIIRLYPKMNMDCLDENELTPLQHACHIGHFELAKLLLDSKANINFAQRKDGYTPLMFAAIGSRSDIVRLLLERGVDITIENCVNRNAAQMAAFVGQTKIVAIINSWIPYETSIEPYTRCRELEDKPRISSKALGKLLHNYVVYPSVHPVKLLMQLKENLPLIKHANEFIFVLENLSSKSLKPPMNEEVLSLKYYYLSYLIEYCTKVLKNKDKLEKSKQKDNQIQDDKSIEKSIETIIKKLVKRENPDDTQLCTQQLDHFILECLMKFPYTQLAIFKTMTFALTKREAGDYTALAILTQSLNGPRVFNQPAEACCVCGEVDNNKKCSNCKSVYYCGPSCQKVDWFQHKKICKHPEEIPLLNKDKDANEIEVPHD